MSLQVWLPLTKDLRQQGLSSMTVENHNATLNTAGKLGSCYYFNGSQQWLQLSNNLGNFYNNDWSVACWLKPTDSTRSIILSEYSGTGASNVAIELTTARIVRLYWNGSPDISFSTAGALPLNEWTHLVMAKQGRIVKLYFNGELKQTYTNSSDFSTRISACQPRIGDDYRGNSGNSVSYQGYMNDFRMYDHCLSPMEVKELAKGLVLHYPLNRQGWGQENLAMDSHDLTHTCAKENKYISKRRTADVIQLRSDGFYECKSFNTSFGGLAIYANQLNLSSGDILTYSFYVYTDGSTKSLSFYPMMYNSSGSRDTSSTLSISLDGGSYTAGNSKSWGHINNTIPQKHWVTFVWNETMESIISNGGKIELSIQPHGTWNNTNEYVCLFAPKLEVGSIPTPWCPNSSDALATTMGLNSTTEYDCSGFCNNGTRTGTFTWTSDTPKYSVSTKFNGTEYMVIPFTCGSISDAVTVACWGYENNWNTSSAERLIGAATNSSGWCIGDYGSENTLFAFYANGGYNVATGFKQLTAGWHHFVITFDGLNLKYYVDGQQFSSKTFSTKQVVTGNYNINIGRHYGGSYSFKGNMSDVRIYATALSADDVKSLYQNCATIDPDGTIRGQIRS